jgi:hypothetical protein
MNKFFMVMIVCMAVPAIASQRPKPIREDFGPEKPSKNTGMPQPIQHSFGGRPENMSGYYGDNGKTVTSAAPLGNVQGRAVGNDSDSSGDK